MPQYWYHTQEKRNVQLTDPIICKKDNAWFGKAFYFWFYEDDAISWGKNFKAKTGSFEIYQAEINSENILDTVFNKEHYLFWVSQVEKVLRYFVKRSIKPTIKDINDYFIANKVFKDVEAIMFQDISSKPDFYHIMGFYYKKRIQIAVYTLKPINNFHFSLELDA